MSSSSKGKEPAIPPLPNPATGSANPAATLSSLWGYLQPALNHLVKSPSNNATKAPSIDVEYYAGIHSACYNYITAQTEVITSNIRKSDAEMSPNTATDLYGQLDKYFADAARELLLGAPHDDSDLIHYIIPCFNRFSAGAQSVNRLLNYVNRHYVKRAVDEDKGWLSINDVLEHVAKTANVNDTREKLSNKFREKRIEELKKWGYVDNGSSQLMAQAESFAEAASDVSRIVPILSLAHRRFRADFIDPLLAVPKTKGKKVKNKIPKSPSGSGLPGPKGRLARAVKDLLESTERDVEERDKLAGELAVVLRTVGIRPDHPLRKKLDRFAPPLTAG
ncbi:hypothetical protein BDZ89DRAFT_961716 [Hymenopellis radicata]|nr:hypothetical protein BDZ89DRAFT_961716 [Hymenopellis radicata]